MSRPILCRLCVNTCHNSKGLYDDNGRGNELYNITSNYFHPKIVNMEEAKHLTAICSQCWRHICDFHSFQTSVLVAQLKLLQGVIITGTVSQESLNAVHQGRLEPKGNTRASKAPDEQSRDTVPLQPKLEASSVTKDKALAEVEIINLDSDGEFSSDSEFSSDDEVPLATNASEDLLDDYETHVAVYPRDDQGDAVVDKWLPAIKCAVCLKSYSKLKQLQQHFRQRHPHEQFYVKCCSRKFTKRSTIKEHALLHKDPATFKCGLCVKICSNKQNLRSHVKIKHPKHNKIVCKVCGKKIKSYKDQILHYSTAHQTDQPPKAVVQANGLSRYPCSECGALSRTILSFYHHFWRVHKTGAGMRQNVANCLQNKDIYACAFCPSTFRELDAVSRHRQEQHTQEMAEPFYHHIGEKENVQTGCVGAPSSTRTNGCLAPADAGHKPKRKHKSLRELQTMDEPVKKDLRCPNCTDDFPSPRDMLEHLAAKHLSLTLYKCPCCPETFEMVTHLVKHRKQKHPQESKTKYYESIDDSFNKLYEEFVIS